MQDGDVFKEMEDLCRDCEGYMHDGYVQDFLLEKHGKIPPRQWWELHGFLIYNPEYDQRLKDGFIAETSVGTC